MIAIVVNGRRHEFDQNESGSITYEEVCKLAGLNPEYLPTMTCRSVFRHSHTLSPGDIGPVESGAIYNVAHTGNA